MATAAPHPRLAGQVLRYCGYAECTSQPLRRLEAPFGGIVLILSFGDQLRLRDGEGNEATHVSFAAGLSDAPTFTEHLGRQRGIQVDLSPPAARALFGIPLRELTNRAVSLEDLTIPRSAELVERLDEAAGWEARFALLDAAIGRRLETVERRPPSAVVEAWDRLRRSDGRLEIEELSRDLGYSRRRLTALFTDELGLRPKTFARVLRFERAAALLGRDDGRRFAEIAHDCGYYDQAHLNRDFRQFAGASPSEYVGRLLPDGAGVAAPEDVPFVQDIERAAA
jgi:AraC-like DNA-binding protein